VVEAGPEMPKANHQPAILVVEDQEALRGLMVKLLKRNDMEALDAGSAPEGLSIAQARGGKIDLAILDMVIPGMSGLDLASDLIREFPNIRILYMSGYVDSIAMDVIARRSPEAVLLKPFNEATLIQRVNQLLAKPPRIEPGPG